MFSSSRGGASAVLRTVKRKWNWVRPTCFRKPHAWCRKRPADLHTFRAGVESYHSVFRNPAFFGAPSEHWSARTFKLLRVCPDH